MKQGVVAHFVRLVRVSLMVTLLAAALPNVHAEDPKPALKIGYIGSLSSFAANYGTAVLQGAKLAATELTRSGTEVELIVEDDQSQMKNSALAYEKLKSVDKVTGIIGGSWWINGIVQKAERDEMPLLSCETLYNDDVVLGKSYFIMHGELAEWVRIYGPLIAARGWKRGAVVRFVSSFGATIEREMKSLFAKQERTFAGAIEYGDLEMSDAGTIATQLKKLNPDVVYIDAQPGGLVSLLNKMREAGLSGRAILTNMITDDVRRDKLLDLTPFSQLYFTKRATYDSTFAEKFRRTYGQEPFLGSDLGYYSVYLLAAANGKADPVGALKSGMTVQGKTFTFDEHNVYSGTKETIFHIVGNEAQPAVDIH